MSKHFLINPNVVHVPKYDIEKVQMEKVQRISDSFSEQETTKSLLLKKQHNLKAPEGKVIIQIDLQSKNSWTFSNGQKIRYERQFDNFNRRQTEPVNAWVIDGKDMEQGAEILIHPNAISEHFQIYNYSKVSGKQQASEIRYYSIPEDMCFCYRSGDEWLPLKPYEKALRIFKPYTGILTGIEPTMIKDCLYVLTGEYKGKAVLTLKASDYQIIFQGINGKEDTLIRFRPNGDGKEREPEAIAIHEEYTKDISRGKLLIGYTKTDCKTINDL